MQNPGGSSNRSDPALERFHNSHVLWGAAKGAFFLKKKGT